jgi:hypothetical protein
MKMRNANICVLFLGMVLASISGFAQTRDHGSYLGCTTGNLSDEPSVTQQKIGSFLDELKRAVEENKRGQVAKMISYPLHFATYKVKKEVRSEKEFLAQYDQIFPKELKALLLKQRPECVGRIGAQGFTISRGEIWFDVFPDGAVKIFTITAVVMADE